MNGNRDFFGNPLNDGAPDFGVYEQIGSGAVNDTSAENKLNRHEKALNLFAWTKRKFPDMVAIPAEGGSVSVAMNMSLQGSMPSSTRLDTMNNYFPKSSLTWTGTDWNVQPKTGDLTKKNNNSLTFKLSPVKKDASLPVLLATLQDGDQKDEWGIPVYISHKVEMGNLSKANADGDMAKWKNIPSLEVNSSEQVFQMREKWQSPQDGSCSMKAAISGDNLLLAIDVTDKDISYNAAVPSQNDAVEIFFDARSAPAPVARPGAATVPGGAAGGPTAGGGRGGAGGVTIGQIILVAQEKDGPVEKAYWLQRRNSVPAPAEIKTFYHRTATGYTMELSIPFTLAGFRTTPVKGESIALEVVLDNRSGSGDTGNLIRMSGSGYPNSGTNSKAFSRFLIK